VLLCGDSIFAREWGTRDSQAVFCWHGAGGSADDFEPIAPKLVERLGVRVIAIDAPGHARSASRPAHAFRLSALAKLTTEILDELGVERFVFLGFSWGATVGCWVAVMHPERTLGLALVEGGHIDFADIPGFDAGRSLDRLISDAEAFAATQGEAFGSHTPEAAGAMIHGLCQEPGTATFPRLAAAGVPVLFVGARQDEPAAEVERLAHLVPQAEVVELTSPGHDLLRDAPADVARVVGDWLAKLQGR
jgi:pimeloyl-ACP methyl ester carboxylesterase